MARLAELVEALEAKAQELRAIDNDTLMGELVQKPMNDGAAATLEEIAARVRQIDGDHADNQQALDAVKSMASELDRKVAEANSQQRDLPDVASFLLNPGKLIESLREMGRLDGERLAAEIMRGHLAGT